MKAKAIKKPRAKKLNAEPIQPKPEISLEEINKERERYWKLIDSGLPYNEYVEAWFQYDHFTNLKSKHLKK